MTFRVLIRLIVKKYWQRELQLYESDLLIEQTNLELNY